MIGRSQILKLAQAGKLLHCVTWDFGPVQPNGLGGLTTNHFATKAQADKEMNDTVFSCKRTYSTRQVTQAEREQAAADYFFLLV